MAPTSANDKFAKYPAIRKESVAPTSLDIPGIKDPWLWLCELSTNRFDLYYWNSVNWSLLPVSDFDSVTGVVTLLNGQQIYSKDYFDSLVYEPGDTEPTNPVEGATWVDTSSTPYILKIFDNGSWVAQIDENTNLSNADQILESDRTIDSNGNHLTITESLSLSTTNRRNTKGLNINVEPVADFTGVQVGKSFSVTSSTYSADGYTVLMESTHVGDSTQPTAKIATKYTSSGSYLYFGTSRGYSLGITDIALTLDPRGRVFFGAYPVIPTYTTVQRNALTSVPEGSLVIDSTLEAVVILVNGNWKVL